MPALILRIALNETSAGVFTLRLMSGEAPRVFYDDTQGCACLPKNSGMFFPQPMRGRHLVLQLCSNFVEADLSGGTGGKAAVGVQGDAGRFKVLEGRLDAGDDFIG